MIISPVKMLPFNFKISLKNNTLHFFPKGDKFPFYMTIQSEDHNRSIEIGIQQTFQKLLRIQKTMKKRCMNEERLKKLLKDINQFMDGTNAIWIKSNEIENGEDFILFRLVNRSLTLTRPKLCLKMVPKASERTNTLESSQEKDSNKDSPFFRPWN